MRSKEEINKLQRILLDNGNNMYARWLNPYISTENNTYKIAVVGEILKGKSTFINKLLGSDIVVTGIIPTEAEVHVKYNEITGIITDDNIKTDLQNLEDVLDDNEKVTVEVPNSFLLNNNIEIIEFPGLNTIKDDEDFLAMTDIYSCDAAVLVISAEQLLSINECNFIEKYSRYVSANRLLVVINKIDIVPANEYEKVLEYAKNKITSRFTGVKYALLSENVNFNGTYNNMLVGVAEVCKLLSEWSKASTENEDKKQALENVISIIKEKLNIERQEKLKELELDEEQLKKKQKSMEQAKSLEAGKYERIGLELQIRRNSAINKVSEFISTGMEGVKNEMVKEFIYATDKSLWCNEKFSSLLECKLQVLAKEADRKLEEIYNKDIIWVNECLNAEYDFAKADQNIVRNMQDVDTTIQQMEVKSYGKYKKYMPIGIGGSVIIGYCIFRIIGAVVCIGGGLTIYKFIDANFEKQNNKVEKKVENELRRLKITVAKLTENTVEKIYSDIVEQYEVETKAIITTKYKEFLDTESDVKLRVAKYDQVLKIL